MPQPSLSGPDDGPPVGTPRISLRFPTLRDGSALSRRRAGRLLVGTGLAAAGGVLSAATAAAAGAAGAHTTVVVRVPDPTAPTGTRPARVSYRDPGDLRARSVPVIHLLHGLPGAAGDFEHSGATTAMFAAAAAIGLRLVVVCPSGATLRPADLRTDTEWGDDVEGQWQLETWMHTRLRAAVEGTAVRATRDRIIGGFSMGGFGAAMIGMRHPDRYGSVAAIAGYFHLDDPDGVFGPDRENQLLHRPDHLISAHRTQRYLLADAADDPLALTAPETPRFARLLRNRGYVPEVHRPAGSHDFALVVDLMPAVARWVADR